MYHLLKKFEPEEWKAKDVKITLECYEFLLSRTEQLCDMEIVKYKCYSFAEKIRYFHAQINEKFSCKLY